MRSTLRRYGALAWISVALLAAPATGQSPPTFGIEKGMVAEPGLLTAAQPTPEQLGELAKAGYKTILDLRPPMERRGYDEPAAVRQAGLAYVNVPVTLPTLDDETLDRFFATMRTAERPMVLHCASANRVGALYYSYLVLEKGVPEADALKQAEAVGLRQQELREKVQGLVAARKSKGAG